MAIILNIETATKNCSVSLAADGNLILCKELHEDNYSHAEKLHVFIQQVLLEAHIPIDTLAAIAVSKGPGSYTGLRIGVSAAKGLCFALNKPLISVDTLNSLSRAILVDTGYIVPLLDARRMEVYAAVYDVFYQEQRGIQAEIIDVHSFSKYLQRNKVHFLGDGVEKCKPILNHKNAIFIDDVLPSSKEMISLSFQKYQNQEFENLAYFEPFYLKDFLVTPQKKKV